MTLSAISTSEHQAQILSDGLAYDRTGRHVVPSPLKVHPLAGLPAVVASRGLVSFGGWWRNAADEIGDLAGDFDAFCAAADQILPQTFDQLADEYRRGESSTALAVGYSPEAGRFVAYCWASELGFRRLPLEPVYVQPTPWAYRPSLLEHLRALPLMAADGAQGAHELARWGLAPAPPAPTTRDEWIELAVTCHRDRALRPELQVFIGGDVTLTTVTREGTSSEVVHRFDDPDEFLAMVAGTEHPLARQEAAQPV